VSAWVPDRKLRRAAYAAGFASVRDDKNLVGRHLGLTTFLTNFTGKTRSMREEKWYHVYILASQRNGTLYVGVTNDLARRTWEHDQGVVEGFTRKYSVKLLVYYETFGDITAAIAREKRLKRWHRAWKLELIENANPTWKNLFDRETGRVGALPGSVFQLTPPLSSRP
jgi:putative endonuclease